jgi:hypothetical protein
MHTCAFVHSLSLSLSITCSHTARFLSSRQNISNNPYGVADAPFKPSPTVIWACVAGAIGLLFVIWLLIKISLWRGFQRSADAYVMPPHLLLLAENWRWFLLLVLAR